MLNAEIISDALQRMGSPSAELFSVKDAARILRARTAFYQTKESQGDQKHAQSYEDVYPNCGDTVLSITSPDWVERRAWVDGCYNEWCYVPTVNIDSIGEWRDRPAVAFYKNADGQLVLRSSNWFSGCADSYRIWYQPDAQNLTSIDDGQSLPPNFAFMLSADIRYRGVTVILNKASEFADEYPVNDLKITGWKAIQNEAAEELAEWQAAFEEYRNRSRGARRGRMRRNVLRNTW